MGVRRVYTLHMGLPLTEEEIDQVWETQGMKHRVSRFRKFLIERGLGPMIVSEDVLARHIKEEFLINFFVKGVVEDARGRQKFPTEADSNAEGEEER